MRLPISWMLSTFGSSRWRCHIFQGLEREDQLQELSSESTSECSVLLIDTVDIKQILSHNMVTGFALFQEELFNLGLEFFILLLLTTSLTSLSPSLAFELLHYDLLFSRVYDFLLALLLLLDRSSMVREAKSDSLIEDALNCVLNFFFVVKETCHLVDEPGENTLVKRLCAWFNENTLID